MSSLVPSKWTMDNAELALVLVISERTCTHRDCSGSVDLRLIRRTIRDTSNSSVCHYRGSAISVEVLRNNPK